jgi:hypothetical protein
MTAPATHFQPYVRTAFWLIACAALLNMGGCQMLGFMAQPFGKNQSKQVKARYTELQGQRVAVLVAAADRTLVNYPQAREALTKTISRRLAENLENITLMNPDQIIEYQQDNPYWHTLRYSRLIEKLEVNRIVLVDLIDYRTHEPGNRHVLAGVINANVGVIDATADDPDNLTFNAQVNARYPEESRIGVVQQDQQTVQLAAVKQFTRKAAGLFYDHKVKE